MNTSPQLYTIRVSGGISQTAHKDKMWLSSNAAGDGIELRNAASSSGQWLIEQISGTSYYHIKISPDAGIPNGRMYLSSNDVGSNVDLGTTDDASGKQRWYFV